MVQLDDTRRLPPDRPVALRGEGLKRVDCNVPAVALT